MLIIVEPGDGYVSLHYSAPYLFACVQDEIFKSLFSLKLTQRTWSGNWGGSAKTQTTRWLMGKWGWREEAGRRGKRGQRLACCYHLLLAPLWGGQEGSREVGQCLLLGQAGMTAGNAFSAAWELSHGLPAMPCSAHLLIKSHSAKVLAQNLNVLKNRNGAFLICMFVHGLLPMGLSERACGGEAEGEF